MNVYERQITIIVHFLPNVFEKYEISLVQLTFPREGVKKIGGLKLSFPYCHPVVK